MTAISDLFCTRSTPLIWLLSPGCP